MGVFSIRFETSEAKEANVLPYFHYDKIIREEVFLRAKKTTFYSNEKVVSTDDESYWIRTSDLLPVKQAFSP